MTLLYLLYTNALKESNYLLLNSNPNGWLVYAEFINLLVICGLSKCQETNKEDSERDKEKERERRQQQRRVLRERERKKIKIWKKGHS